MLIREEVIKTKCKDIYSLLVTGVKRICEQNGLYRRRKWVFVVQMFGHFFKEGVIKLIEEVAVDLQGGRSITIRRGCMETSEVVKLKQFLEGVRVSDWSVHLLHLRESFVTYIKRICTDGDKCVQVITELHEKNK